jgi:hypothetical protein
MSLIMLNRDNSSKANMISRITRRKVASVFKPADWWGDIDEVAFLSRLYDLEALPSTDTRHPDAKGDITRHRVGNWDWEEDWVFSDERFGLEDGPDENFLRFLVETVHPEVRTNPEEVRRIVKEINSHLARDGWELIPLRELSGYPVFGWRARAKSSVQAPEGFPLELEALVATTAEVLKHRGNARELAVLANSTFRVEQVSYDNWNPSRLPTCMSSSGGTVSARLAACIT